MTFLNPLFRRHLVLAALAGVIAAGAELAALGTMERIGGGTTDGLQLLILALAQNGDGPQQRLGVGMGGVGENVFHLAVAFDGWMSG